VRALVIGLGNDHRGDDAAGLEAARRLAPVLDGEADVRAHPGEPIDLIHELADADLLVLIDAWAEADLVVLVDATRSGLPPGSVRRYRPITGEDPPRGLGSSSHAVDLRVALDLARAMGMAPRELVVFGVEGARFELGASCSEAVTRALDDVVERVADEVRAARAAGTRPAAGHEGGPARA
jgi:hydrogenase maturation protease